MSHKMTAGTCKKALLALAVTVAFVFVAGIMSVRPAYAKSLAVSRVHIDATVNSDGTIDVVETRTFNFSGSYNGVYWKIPYGYNKANGQTVDVSFTGVTVKDTYGTKTLDEGHESGFGERYEVQNSDSVKELKIYSAHSDETADITISYTLTNVATKWDDTSEIYWKFVSDGWETGSDNVTCTINLPVPAGQNPTTGDGTVRAWAHGPLDGNVSISGGTITYTFPGIGESEFAEARVVFPTDWLPGAQTVSGTKLSSILAEEQSFADKANQKRTVARIVIYGLYVLAAVFVIGGIFLIVRMRSKYRKVMAPNFTDEYFRDMPSEDHPAVLGMLYRGEEIDSSALTATLMRLSDEKSIRLDKAKVKGAFGRTKDDFCLTKLKDVPVSRGYGSAEGVTAYAQKIDARALDLFFKTIAPKTDHTFSDGDDSGSKLILGDIKKVAKEHPESFSEAYDKWEDAVRDGYTSRFSEDSISFNGVGVMVFVAVLEFGFAILGGIAGIATGLSLLNVVLIAVPAILVGVFAVLAITGFDKINREGIEILAKTKALRNWLLNFTHLNEAIPQDVILWNKLLVMAVALGVSEKVIEQLKVACPEILEDPRIMPTYGWYYYGDSFGRDSAIAAVGNTVAASHAVSTASLAGSSNSSGSGFGGGASFGGGGFGGGGGGGGF